MISTSILSESECVLSTSVGSVTASLLAARAGACAVPLDQPPNAPTPSLAGGPTLQGTLGRCPTTEPAKTFDRIVGAAGAEFDVGAEEPADLLNPWVRRRACSLGLL
jgi:hypothetical protein